MGRPLAFLSLLSIIACGVHTADEESLGTDSGLCAALSNRASSCFEDIASGAELQRYRASCDMRNEAFLSNAREGVQQRIADCVGDLTCPRLDTYDDRCFPPVIADVAGDLIPPDTVAACVTDNNTEACETFLRRQDRAAPGLIGDCLNRHLACAVATDGAVLIDLCVSLSMLQATARDEAARCLQENVCDDVQACLELSGAMNW